MAGIARRIWGAINGAKTLLSAALFFSLAVGDYLNYIPIRPLLNHYLGEEAASVVVMFMTLYFASLRYWFTNGPAKFRKPRKDGLDTDEPDQQDPEAAETEPH